MDHHRSRPVHNHAAFAGGVLTSCRNRIIGTRVRDATPSESGSPSKPFNSQALMCSSQIRLFFSSRIHSNHQPLLPTRAVFAWGADRTSALRLVLLGRRPRPRHGVCKRDREWTKCHTKLLFRLSRGYAQARIHQANRFDGHRTDGPCHSRPGFRPQSLARWQPKKGCASWVALHQSTRQDSR